MVERCPSLDRVNPNMRFVPAIHAARNRRRWLRVPRISLALVLLIPSSVFGELDSDSSLTFDDQPRARQVQEPPWFLASFLDLREDLEETVTKRHKSGLGYACCHALWRAHDGRGLGRRAGLVVCADAGVLRRSGERNHSRRLGGADVPIARCAALRAGEGLRGRAHLPGMASQAPAIVPAAPEFAGEREKRRGLSALR